VISDLQSVNSSFFVYYKMHINGGSKQDVGVCQKVPLYFAKCRLIS